METTDNIPASAFTPSSVKLTKPDERDVKIAEIDALCHKLRDIALKQREAFVNYLNLKSSAMAANAAGKPFDLDGLLKAKTVADMNESDIYNLRDKIIFEQTAWNRGRDVEGRISISFTEDGLPIRVSKCRRTLLWG